MYGVHKTLYASGFLFHIPSQQILLQQKQSISPVTTTSWVLFEKQYSKDKKPEDVFKGVLSKILNLDVNSLNKIYSYNINPAKIYSLFYATIDELKEFAPSQGYIFRWFSFKEVLKIRANEQTKHDIVVGQRVIDALERDNDANLQKRIEEAIV